MTQSPHIILQEYRVTKHERQTLNQHYSCIVWFTGLSGSGKSTLANGVEQKLFEQGVRTYVLDGDNIRYGLNNNVDFTIEGRKENIRRIGEVAKLFVDAGIVVLAAFISPFREDRDRVRSMVGKSEFIEVYVDCPIEICEQRDVKGLYKKARAGEIPEFTGISSPFEPPLNPEITIQTSHVTIPDAVEQVTGFILNKITIKK